MFDDLHDKLGYLGKRIRAIWIADMAHQGQSYVLNEDALGNDRTFRTDIWGCLDLANCSSELVGLCAGSPVLDKPEAG